MFGKFLVTTMLFVFVACSKSNDNITAPVPDNPYSQYEVGTWFDVEYSVYENLVSVASYKTITPDGYVQKCFPVTMMKHKDYPWITSETRFGLLWECEVIDSIR